MSATNELLSSAEVCRLTGVSFRQLDYWDRTGLVKPSAHTNAYGLTGSGVPRTWSFEDAVRVRLIERMLHAGVSLQRVRQLMDAFSGQPYEPFILSDGKQVWRCATEQDAARLIQQGTAYFALNVGKVREDLAEVVGR